MLYISIFGLYIIACLCMYHSYSLIRDKDNDKRYIGFGFVLAAYCFLLSMFTAYNLSNFKPVFNLYLFFLANLAGLYYAREMLREKFLKDDMKARFCMGMMLAFMISSLFLLFKL